MAVFPSVKLFDGQQAQHQWVTVTLTDTHWFVEPVESASESIVSAQFEWQECQLTLQPGAQDFRLSLPSQQIVMLPNTVQNRQSLLPLLPRSESLLDRLEAHWQYAVAAILITILVGYSTVKYGIPLAADKVAPYVSVDVFDSAVKEQLDTLSTEQEHQSTLSQARREALTSRFYQVLQAVKPEHLYSVHFIQGGEHLGANAFAFPTGDIVFTDELINLMENDDQIVAIFLHEIGHVELRHTLRNLLRQTGIVIISAFILGDVSDVIGHLSAAAMGLMQLSYSREFEAEADEYALQTAAKAQIAPVAFQQALILLRDKNGELGHYTPPEILSTHPSIQQRIEHSHNVPE